MRRGMEMAMLCTVALALAAGPASGDGVFTWAKTDGTVWVDGLWSVSANWTFTGTDTNGDGIPGASDEDFNINFDTGAGGRQGKPDIDVDGSRTIRHLLITGGGGSRLASISGDPGETLTIYGDIDIDDDMTLNVDVVLPNTLDIVDGSPVFNGSISGSGGLTVNSGQSATLNASNTFAGNVLVNGTVDLGAAGGLGAGSTTVNGTLTLTDDAATATSATFNAGSTLGLTTISGRAADYTGKHPTEVYNLDIDGSSDGTLIADSMQFRGASPEVTTVLKSTYVVNIPTMKPKDGNGATTLTINVQQGANYTQTFNTAFHDADAGDPLALIVELDKNTALFNYDSTFTGGLTVSQGDSGGTRTLTAPAGLSTPFGTGDITVDTTQNGAILELLGEYIADTAMVTLDADTDSGKYGILNIGAGVDDTIAALVLGGTTYDSSNAAGQTFGSLSSGADFQDDNHFLGSGVVRIVPEPTTMVILGLGGFGLLLRRRRK